MNPRSIFSFLLSLLVLAVLVGVGVGIYQAGISQGIVDAGRFPAGAAVPIAGYGYGWGHGFGFLGFLIPLFFLFLLFGLLRAAFGRGRGWGGGYGPGHGYGKGWGPGPGFGGPEAWREERERRMSELHRRLHEEESKGSTGSTGDGPAASGSTR